MFSSRCRQFKSVCHILPLMLLTPTGVIDTGGKFNPHKNGPFEALMMNGQKYGNPITYNI